MAGTSSRKWSRIVLVAGFLISVAAYFILEYKLGGGLSSKFAEQRFIIATLLFLVTVIFTQYLQGLEIENRIENQLEQLKSQIETIEQNISSLAVKHSELIPEVKKTINAVSRTETLLSECPGCRNYLEELIQLSGSVIKSWGSNQIMKEQLITQLRQAVRKAEDLSKGRFETYFFELENYLRKRVEGMKKYLVGMSRWEIDERWWIGHPEGERFFKANEEAIKRGCDIYRVFLCKELTPSLAETMRKHKSIGVRVYFITPEKLPKGVRPEDGAVVDGEFAFYSKTDGQDQVFLNKYSFNRDDIDNQLGILEALACESNRLKDENSPV